LDRKGDEEGDGHERGHCKDEQRGGLARTRRVGKGSPSAPTDRGGEVSTMQGLATGVDAHSTGAQRRTTRSHSEAVIAASGLVPANCVIAPGGCWSIPRLGGVPIEQELEGYDKAAAHLAANLLSVDIARAEDWQASKGRPSEFIHRTLDRWVAAHGAAQIDRRFSWR